MWIGGDGLMFALMMLVYLMWSTDGRAVTTGRGWLEAARRASLGSLVTAHTARGAAGAAPGAEDGATGPADPAPALWDGRGGIDEDDEHLAAYNAFLARLNEAESGPRK
jgi:hypothetical protein